jgi:hypothetical protein
MRARKLSAKWKTILAASVLANLAVGGYLAWRNLVPEETKKSLSLPRALAQARDVFSSPHSAAPAKEGASSPRAAAQAKEGAPAARSPAQPKAAPAATRAPAGGTDGIRVESGRYTYFVMIRSLDPRDESARPAEVAADALAGPAPGTAREVLELADLPKWGASAIHVSQRKLEADDEAAGAPAALRSGSCRVQVTVECAGKSGSGQAGGIAALSGTYHEDSDSLDAKQWDENRLPLWRYQTADGHGGRFHYEVYLERR